MYFMRRFIIFFSSRRRHTRWPRDWSSDVCSSDLRVIQHLAPVLQHQILYSSNRYKYIQQKLQAVIARATFILSEQARQSGFSPIGIELGFGEKETLQPLQIPLPNGFELLLRGRIEDRKSTRL